MQRGIDNIRVLEEKKGALPSQSVLLEKWGEEVSRKLHADRGRGVYDYRGRWQDGAT